MTDKNTTSSDNTKSQETCEAVFDLLLSHGDTRESERVAFMRYFGEGDRSCLEFRSVRNLGFGGKVYFERGKWRVSMYPEDETPQRLKLQNFLNTELQRLSFGK